MDKDKGIYKSSTNYLEKIHLFYFTDFKVPPAPPTKQYRIWLLCDDDDKEDHYARPN